MIPTRPAAVSASTPTYLHADPKLAAWVAAEDDLRQYMQKLTCRYVDKWIYIGRSELTSTLPEVATGLDLKASIEGQ